ncbi:hypothetical protein BHM03_00018190, partial [Ensete ventricosum]
CFSAFLYQAVLETVARVTTKKNETKEEKYVIILSFQFHDVFNLDNENRAEDIPTLIDRKVVITGYLLAGSIIGPGGFRFISEMVQVGAFALLPVTFSLWK